MFETFCKYWWIYVLLGLGCYFFCNINFAIAFSHLIKKSDVRNYGSGNPGTTNMFRVYGLRMGALTFLCDAMKGVVCCLVARLAFIWCESSVAVTTAGYFAGLFAVFGHVFPVFYRFRGGKGVATSIGACFVLQPILSLCLVVPCLVILLVTDRVSVMSLFLAFFMITWSWILWATGADFAIFYSNIDLLCCVLVTLTFSTMIYAHRHNIERILLGKESKTGFRKALIGKSDKIVK